MQKSEQKRDDVWNGVPFDVQKNVPGQTPQKWDSLGKKRGGCSPSTFV